jgi:LDH2 family malate/lactate/ureidoglycolate dehydrogenase
MPDGWIIDEQGEPLTDPAQTLAALEQGRAALLPLGGAGELLGGHKGYGLGVIVEILSAALCEGKFMTDLLGYAEDGSRQPFMLGHFFLAIDIEHFVPLEASKRITGQIMRNLQNAQRASGQDRIYVAGEKEYEKERQVRERGVPVNRALRLELQRMRDALGISGYESHF